MCLGCMWRTFARASRDAAIPTIRVNTTMLMIVAHDGDVQ